MCIYGQYWKLDGEHPPETPCVLYTVYCIVRTEVVPCVCSVPTSWAWLCTTGCLFYVISPCTSLLLPPEPGHVGGDFVILSPLVSWVGPSFCVLCVSDSGENAVGHGAAAAAAVKALQYWNHYYRRRWHSISLSGKTSIVVFFMRQECGKIKIKFVFFLELERNTAQVATIILINRKIQFIWIIVFSFWNFMDCCHWFVLLRQPNIVQTLYHSSYFCAVIPSSN